MGHLNSVFEEKREISVFVRLLHMDQDDDTCGDLGGDTCNKYGGPNVKFLAI